MTLVPDFGIGVAVFTNRSPSEVPATLTWYLIDRLRGRDPVDWRERFRNQREEFIAHLQVDKDAREKARHIRILRTNLRTMPATMSIPPTA